MAKTVPVRISLPEPLAEGLDFLVSSGLYTSRSEVINEAIRRLIHSETKHLNCLKQLGWWP